MDNDIKQEQTEFVEETKSVSIRELLFLLKKNLILIVAVILITVAAGFWYSTTVKPTYTARCTVKVKASLKSESFGYNDITLSKVVLPTLSEMLKTDIVVNEANKLYKENGNEGYINAYSIGMSYGEDSEIIKIFYTDADANVAKVKLETVFNALSNIVDEPAEEGSTSASKYFEYKVEIKNLTTNYSITKNTSQNTIIKWSLLAGVCIAAVIVFLRFILDDTITTKDELERVTGVKVFAFIENVDPKDVRHNKSQESVETDDEEGDSDND